ncbi:MAG: glycosyl hydrolase 108 family protein [Vicinamibacterales bacterium]
MTTEEIVGCIIDRFEGHTFTNDPADPGGATKFGVTLRALTDYRRKKSGNPTLVVTADDVRAMTRGEAVDVLMTAYAVGTCLVFILDERLRFVVIDYAVHAGPAAAIAALQRGVGVKVDGLFGPISQDAVNRHANAVQLGAYVLAARAEAMQRLMAARPAMQKYQGGWFARIIANMRQLAA